MEAEKIDDDDLGRVAFDSILYNLLVIGEAVKSLSKEFQQAIESVPWRDIAGMRDILAHEYFRVSSAIVRKTIDSPLKLLEEAINRRHQA